MASERELSVRERELGLGLRSQELASEPREDWGTPAMLIVPYGGGAGGSLPQSVLQLTGDNYTA